MKQTNEPLKDKVIECDDGQYDENDDIVIIKGKRRSYREEDVAGAVAWLKDKIDWLNSVDICCKTISRKEVLKLIDEAFEDVREDEKNM